jgi:hypothetical protein
MLVSRACFTFPTPFASSPAVAYLIIPNIHAIYPIALSQIFTPNPQFHLTQNNSQNYFAIHIIISPPEINLHFVPRVVIRLAMPDVDAAESQLLHLNSTYFNNHNSNSSK